jgi:hypothetical protein
MAGTEQTAVHDVVTVIDTTTKGAPAAKQPLTREECEIRVASTLAEGFLPSIAGQKPGTSADKASVPSIESGRKAAPATLSEVTSSARKAEAALSEAARNRGRETNAFKTTHDHLQLLLGAEIDAGDKSRFLKEVLDGLAKIKDWDKPQWFKKEPANWRDANGRRITEHEFIVSRNAITAEQIARWDEWAVENAAQFALSGSSADEQIACLDNYLVRRVAVDSVKNWLRRRPDEAFIHVLFQALAQNKLYVTEGDMLKVRCMKDAQGRVRQLEKRDGELYFEGTDELATLSEDEHGKYIELPLDTDLIIFEKRTLRGVQQIVPIAQPNAKDPNIQWFGGNQVKKGWGKEQRFFEGPQCFTMEELYGFFPEHFPMRITNSVENGKPTTKTGAAIYGYARDHAGRQARQLIAEYGTVMEGLKRNNSQLINDMRIILGLQRAPQQAAHMHKPAQGISG